MFLLEVIGRFPEEYVMTEFGIEKSCLKQQNELDKSSEDQRLSTNTSIHVEDHALEAHIRQTINSISCKPENKVSIDLSDNYLGSR